MDILYQDEALLVVNKPAGLSTLPDGYNPTLPHVKKLLERQSGRLWIVHRLDKDTSGVLLLARTAAAHRDLNTQFEKHLVNKHYHALVIGNPDWRDKTISLPLQPDGDRQHRTVVNHQTGKSAVTHIRVLERFDKYCLLEAIPETGRTHQIRAHLYAIGLSILGDKLYRMRTAHQSGGGTHPDLLENDSSIVLSGGMGLHARSLEITHPVSGRRCKFTASFPAQFEAVLQQLRSAMSA